MPPSWTQLSASLKPFLPDLTQLYAAIGTTWPAAEVLQVGPVKIRRGLNGGSRVSAATTNGALTPQALKSAEDAMRSLGQVPRFMIRDGEAALDAQLAAAGYIQHDVTQIYVCEIDLLTHKRPPPVSTFVVWPPLSVQHEIWEAGGIGPDRLAIMDRAPMPKTTVLGRIDDAPGGTLYMACAGDIAMVHAVEVHPNHRRKGLAKHMMTAAAASLQMDVVGSYHYRKLPE